jgi:cysteinyl-tRNA synthetase
MRIYNTLTRTDEEITSLNGQKLSFYSCGPTVYNYLHVGNWVAYIRWDVFARALKAEGYDLEWIMNITDVGHLVSDDDEGEDKLEVGAKREGKTAWEVAKMYTDDFMSGLDKLNISVPRHNLVKATDHIPEQIELVEKLEQAGFTYAIDDGVYFDTSKLADYGKLARLRLHDQKEGARVAVNEQKRNPTDFALWKLSPNGVKRDMEWDSPWGKGFPGWHLECSAMAMKYLGETIDVHAGGIDHIPVHHTNEIAQSEAATGKQFARYWLHGNFLMVDGAKISKSLGNGYTLTDIENKGFTTLDFRLFVLQSNYRTESNFTWEGLKGAQTRLATFRALADLRFQPVPSSTVEARVFGDTLQKIRGAINDNLNTPLALSHLSEFEQAINTKLLGKPDVEAFCELLEALDNLFGLDLSESTDITSKQKAILSDRQKARDNKDWQKSDALRDELAAQHIGVRDTPSGQVWFRQ